MASFVNFALTASARLRFPIRKGVGELRPWIRIPYDSTLSARYRFLFKNHFKHRDSGSDNSISINCALTHVCLLKDEWGRRKAPLLYSPREVSHDLTERAGDAGLGPLLPISRSEAPARMSSCPKGGLLTRQARLA